MTTSYRVGRFVIPVVEAYYDVYFVQYIEAEYNNTHHLVASIIDYYQTNDKRISHMKFMKKAILQLYPNDVLYINALISDYLSKRVRVVRSTPHQQVSTFVFRQIGLTRTAADRIATNHLNAGHSSHDVISYLVSHVVPLIE